ncbi:MAG TPA: hypothetical protein VFQ60_03355 [Patescibacteria group bacterium]|nr:hypothetical protein [Patescibacteria group bacterium]
MTVSWSKRRMWATGIISGLLFLLAGTVATFEFGVLWSQWDFPAARFMAMVLRIPAAHVGAETVSYASYTKQLDAERKFLAGPAARAQGLPDILTAEFRRQTLLRTIRVAAVEQIAREQKLMVTPLDVDRSYGIILDRAGTSTTPAEFASFLEDEFGLNVDDFKTYVVRPALIEDTLKVQMQKNTNDPNAFDNLLNDRMKEAVTPLRFSV